MRPHSDNRFDSTNERPLFRQEGAGRNPDEGPAPERPVGGERRTRAWYDSRRPEGRGPRDGRGPRPRPAPRDREEVADQEGVRTGPHAVLALLEERPRQVNRLLFLHNSGNPKLYQLQAKAESLKIPCQQLPEEKLRKYARHHQGVIALCHARELDPWTDVREKLCSMERGLAVVIAGLEDPHNLGACARSALALGAAAMLLPARGGCGLTETAVRASAGALERVSVCRPPVLDQAVLELKQNGWRVVRLWEGAKEALHELKPAPKTLLVIGGEEEGVPSYLRKVSDVAARLPMAPQANSYNASVALSLALYELARQQGFPADSTPGEVSESELRGLAQDLVD